MEKRYQGDDISFSIELETVGNPSITKFSDLDELFVYLYTDKCFIVKYSKKTRAGYLPLTVASDTVLVGELLSADTRRMRDGILYADVMVDKNGKDKTKQENTGIYIAKSLIKIEENYGD
ncbi:hypothetical protein FACS189434_07950 [Bacteroidia bacterium]|nr:hypothetical protein FACS189434_07950 [Bacteroidia bacterium]